MAKFEYAPAPESRAIAHISESYGLFINGEFTPSKDGGAFKTISPATEEVLAEVAEAGPADVDRAVTAARQAYEQRLVQDGRAETRQVPVPHRPDHPGAIPRTGRPGVARQRQADPGIARRRHPAGRGALLLPRGLGRQAGVRGLRPGAETPRRGRPGHPVELPAAHAGLEDRPGAGLRQHGGAQAGRDHAADRADLRRDLPAGRPAARRGQHRHRRRGDRQSPGYPPRDRQGGVHRLHRGGQGDRPGLRAGTRARS